VEIEREYMAEFDAPQLKDYCEDIREIYQKLEREFPTKENFDSTDYFLKEMQQSVAGAAGQACGAAKKRLKSAYFTDFLVAAKRENYDITVTHAKKIAKVFLPGRSSIGEKVLIKYAAKPKRTAANKSAIDIAELFSSALFADHFTLLKNAEDTADKYRLREKLRYKKRIRDKNGK
jgi:hypothetical protein